ncbi:MAG: hypothetical protein NTV23_16170 [Propionibacteriales bacterium]|nr:hypothetical protein [Propionibacteriales bacterium]
METTTRPVRLFLIAALVVVTSCGADRGDPSSRKYAVEPELTSQGKEVRHYDDLAEMAAGSDWILRAKVTDVRVGKTYGDSVEDQVITRLVVLDPIEVVKGVDVEGVPDTLTFEEEGWQGDGRGYVMNGVLWSRPGEEAWFFLRRTRDGSYRLTSSFGRYTLVGKDEGPSGLEPADEGPWAPESATVLSDRMAVSEVVRALARKAVR